MQSIEEISQIEKTAEGFKDEATRQLTQKVLACLRIEMLELAYLTDLEACM